jgi:O-antigen/teichoic acid export membrane protein
LAYLRHALADAAKYSLVALSSIAQGNVERFVLQTMLGPSAVGLLAFFQTLANTIPAILQAGVINIALPKVLHLHGRGLSDRWRFLAKFSAVCAVVSVLMALVIYVAADPIAQFARHAELRGQQHILAILLAVQIVMMTSQPTQYWLEVRCL